MRNQKLEAGLSGGFVLAVTIGGVIGLGILRGPGEIAAVTSNAPLYLALWLLGGLFVLLSTAVTAELVGMTPRSGGVYALVRRAYGPYPGFVLGWVDWLSVAADIALKAVVILEFLAMLVPEAEVWRKPLAVAVTSIFAGLQLRGVALSAFVQKCASAMIAVIVMGMSVLLLFAEPASPVTSIGAADEAGLGRWSLVIATIIFTYDGWLYASYFSGEIKGGAGAVARASLRGVVMVIALYMLFNFALVESTGLPALAGSDLALATALELVMSPAAGGAVIIAAILILACHQNLAYMAGPRILHALSVDGLAVAYARTVGERGNPTFGVAVTWGGSVGLIMIGGFEFLLLLSVFFYVPLYLALIIGMLRLRRLEPDCERPYRAWGHPYSSLFCLLGWGVITIFQGYYERETAIYALAMIAASSPVYFYLTRKRAG